MLRIFFSKHYKTRKKQQLSTYLSLVLDRLSSDPREEYYIQISNLARQSFLFKIRSTLHFRSEMAFSLEGQ